MLTKLHKLLCYYGIHKMIQIESVEYSGCDIYQCKYCGWTKWLL